MLPWCGPSSVIIQAPANERLGFEDAGRMTKWERWDWRLRPEEVGRRNKSAIVVTSSMYGPLLVEDSGLLWPARKEDSVCSGLHGILKTSWLARNNNRGENVVKSIPKSCHPSRPCLWTTPIKFPPNQVPSLPHWVDGLRWYTVVDRLGG